MMEPPEAPKQLPVTSVPGLIFICRMCERMAEQLAQGADKCHLDCGGPRRGRSFPLYKGPLTAGWLEEHCFVCDGTAAKTLRLSGGLEVHRALGVCDRCVKWVVPKNQ